MSHMVIFRTPEGKPGYQPAETVQDAVEVVERLRNEEGVENVRIFRLEEVRFELRPYYKVELAGAGAGAEPVASLESESSDDTADPDVGSSDEVGDSAETEAQPAMEANGDSIDADLSSAPAAEHPPWAAPPPPPPPPGGEDQSGSGLDDEYSSSGQRRGLFGR